ncbi:hypothetical protein DIS24_g11344 [Lasiodiplodia hormozganensis]|uniref:Aristolochene synthase n=1 Tax=Lasiodiplodia hormozganensis TaxID=869390 RepID=A0AA39WV58_9PEZI|nr:hypothetical protein DIS24_g11344 [Lasiodiplodia hormozganensis]
MADQVLQLDKIAAPDDLPEVMPVFFSWNYIPRLPSFINAQEWTFELPIDANRDAVDPSWRNSFPINPKAASLPYHTGLTFARHNRFWRSALGYAAELCELLATDQSYNNTNLTRGGTLASIGQRELKKPEGERFVTFAINLFPQADEERMQLIAAGILFVVTFDDSWEEAPSESLQNVQSDFVARLRGEASSTSTTGSPSNARTPLQTRIDEIVSRCHACDARTGTTCGADFITALIEWVQHPPPAPANFATPRAYLDYRWDDAANAWLVAACRLSIASPIPMGEARLARLVRLVGDHVSIVNDLGSFDKEWAAYEGGRTVVLINLVQVLRESCGLGVDDAKAAAFVLQLLNEREIREELERLKRDEELGVEHWRFVDSLLALIAGNTFYTMTTSRYGGEAARIKKD